jgi:hypothetical protein
MTTCETIKPRLTSYLDGDLAGDEGSVVRGHLRECAACRQIARDEAALRDGLRQLAPVDPPASLWAGVQAQLAAAEVADARRPRWRRGVARWARWAPWMPTMQHVIAGGVLAAAAVVLLYVRSERTPASMPPIVVEATVPAIAPEHPRLPVTAAATAPVTEPAGTADVTADLNAEPARTTASYAQVIEELMQLASSASDAWSHEQRVVFETEVAALRDGISRAAPGRPQQRAQRTLIRYLQGAAVRDVMVLASGGTR